MYDEQCMQVVLDALEAGSAAALAQSFGYPVHHVRW
jgi:hypothetical protein